MPTGDIPFMVEGSDKFPAEGGDWAMSCDHKKRLDKLTYKDRTRCATA